MIGRPVLLAVAVACGLLAAVLYLAASRQTDVVVLARDVDALSALSSDDLETRAFPASAVPDGALADPRRALGRFPHAPLRRGQLVLAASLLDHPVAFSSGLSAPRGTRAIALPVGPVQALGGALVPGSRVDVVAVPAAGRAPAGRVVELVASAALVLDVRGESGGAIAWSRSGATTRDRIASVVVAVPAIEELRVAERSATSTFVLVLAGAER